MDYDVWSPAPVSGLTLSCLECLPPYIACHPFYCVYVSQCHWSPPFSNTACLPQTIWNRYPKTTLVLVSSPSWQFILTLFNGNAPFCLALVVTQLSSLLFKWKGINLSPSVSWKRHTIIDKFFKCLHLIHVFSMHFWKYYIPWQSMCDSMTHNAIYRYISHIIADIVRLFCISAWASIAPISGPLISICFWVGNN